MAGCEVQQIPIGGDNENRGNCSGFSLNNVSKSFANCFDGTDVNLKEYTDAYNELVCFFNIMGTLFSFVTSDVNSKLDILEQHLSSSVGTNYLTVRQMMTYEIGIGLSEGWPNRQLPSGSRTLLRLHRAFAFITRLFSDLAVVSSDNSGATENFSTIVSRAYDATLAPYHSWIIRKGVAVALYAMPSRHAMLLRLKNDGTEEEIVQKLKEAVVVMTPVYNHVQALYTENGLLELR